MTIYTENIVFLDVDGVLNSHNKLIEVYNKTHKPHPGYSYPFDEKCLENLKTIIKSTNSKIVITSTWRKTKIGINILLETLKEYNLDTEVIGYTPILNTKRETEIKTYLNSLGYIPNFIIIDDDSDFDGLNYHLIKTNQQFGLTPENVEEAILKLSKLPVKKYQKKL